MSKQFRHRLLEPYQTLVQRCAQQDLVAADVNDVVAQAQQLAVSAAHFLESEGLPKDQGPIEELRSKLVDVADSYKHGQLRDPARTVTPTTAYGWEFNDQNQFRFLRVEVLAQSERFGTLDLVPAIGEYLHHLNNSLQLGFDQIEPPTPTRPFGNETTVYVTTRTHDAASARIRTYKRTVAGELILADPPEVRFAVR